MGKAVSDEAEIVRLNCSELNLFKISNSGQREQLTQQKNCKHNTPGDQGKKMDISMSDP